MLTHAELKSLLAYERSTGLFRWRASRGAIKAGEIAGTMTYQGYVQISIGGVKYKAHRLAWFYVTGAWPLGEVDHRNTRRNDNRWRNLRDLPGALNAQNKRKAYSRSKTGTLGVSRSGRRFRARICVAGVDIHLGSFGTRPEARAAYVAAKRVMHAGCTL